MLMNYVEGNCSALFQGNVKSFAWFNWGKLQ